ncbi:MAG: glycosyltransferase [Flavobacteriales bacterium]
MNKKGRFGDLFDFYICSGSINSPSQMDAWLDTLSANPLGWFVIGLSLLGLMIQLYYHWGIFGKSVAPSSPLNSSLEPVSVVVSARNEERNLIELVPIIMEQDYPQFELIVINDSSWDDTMSVLKAFTLRYSNLHIVTIDEEKQHMQGKKFAITLGIKAAKYERILLTDADCRPKSNQWIREMAQGLNDKHQIVLGYSPYQTQPGWLNKMIRFDTLGIGGFYLGAAKIGTPYMGVGRNLAYQKELFFRVGGFKNHFRLASGDDDLFVNQVASAHNTITVFAPSAQTLSFPKENWSSWFKQKRRHFTTSPYYKASHRRMLGFWPFSFLLMASALLLSAWIPAAIIVSGGLFILREISYMIALNVLCSRLGERKDIVWLAIPLEFQLHCTNVLLAMANLIRKPQKWS